MGCCKSKANEAVVPPGSSRKPPPVEVREVKVDLPQSAGAVHPQPRSEQAKASAPVYSNPHPHHGQQAAPAPAAAGQLQLQRPASSSRGARSVPSADAEELFKPRESRAEFAAILAQAGAIAPAQDPERGGPARSPLRTELVTGSALGRSADLPLVRKTVRVFFSSTFSDMEQERNDLISDVYPFLRLVARRYGLDFQAVDMRWGVSDEAVDDHNVVQICSEEVARCVAESAGPAFILLGGQKYGYRPIPSEIPVDEFGRVHHYLSALPGVDPASLRLLEKWYQLDENAVPPAYRLLQISTHFPDYINSEDREAKKRAEAGWYAESGALTALLRSAAVAVPDPDRRRLYSVSVTEMEIEGALEALKRAGALDAFYLVEREIEGLAAAAGAGGPHREAIPKFIDCLAAATAPGHGPRAPGSTAGAAPASAPAPAAQPGGYTVDGEAQQMLAALSARVRAAVPPGRRARASTPWQQPLPAPYVRAFSDAVCRLLAGGIASAARAAAAHAAHDPLVLQHTRTARQLSRQCHGRAELKAAVVSYLESTGAEDALPLALVGGSGTGKSSLLGAVWAEACRRAASAGRAPVIVGRFCGTTPLSSDARSVMQSVIEQCADAYEAESSEMIYSHDIRDVAAVFEPTLRWGTAERPLYLFIDALDQLSDAGNGRKLGWLPQRLPPHTRLVVSMIPGEAGGGALESFQDFVGGSDSPNIIRVPVFDRTSAEDALDAWSREDRRALRPAQRAEVLRAFAGCPTPLYLRMCWEEAMEWRSGEAPQAAVIQAGDVPGLVEREMYRLENKYGPGIVSGALGYITLAAKGITISELEDVLSCDDAVLDGLFVWWTPPVRRVPPSLLLRIRSDVGHFLTERGTGDASGASVLGWFHRQFKEAAERRYLYHEGRVREMHEILAAYFGGRYSAGKALRTGAPAPGPASNARPRSAGSTARLLLIGALVDRHVAAQPLMLGPGVANVRRVQMEPAHLLAAGQLDALLHCLADPRLLEAAAAGRCLGHLLTVAEGAMAAAAAAGAPALYGGFFDVKSFLGRHFQQFTLNCPGPSFVLQQAANERDDSLIARGAAPHLAQAQTPWIRRLNKRQGRDPCIFAIGLKYGTGESLKAYGSVDVWSDTHIVVASCAPAPPRPAPPRPAPLRTTSGRWRATTSSATSAGAPASTGPPRPAPPLFLSRPSLCLKPRRAPLGPVRVSNDGARVAVALEEFGHLAVLSMQQGKARPDPTRPDRIGSDMI
eukprot:tig00001208_g7539.t1